MSSLEDFLFVSFQQKNEMKKEKYPDRVEVLLFCSSINLFDVKDFKRNLTDAVYMVRRISLVKSVWVSTLDELQHVNG